MIIVLKLNNWVQKKNKVKKMLNNSTTKIQNKMDNQFRLSICLVNYVNFITSIYMNYYTLNCHSTFYVRMWVIIGELKIFELIRENIFHVFIYLHFWQWAQIAGKLKFYLFQMICVNVCIAQCMNKITSFQPSNLRHHLQQ